MTGAGHDDVVRHGVHVRQRLAVDGAVGDRRGEVAGGVLPPGGRQRGEVGEEVHEHREQILGGAFAALVFGVVAAEHLLGELEHARKVLFGHAEQRQDHIQRVVHGDLGDEVAFGSDLPHPVDVASGQLVDSNLQVAHGFRAEPVGADLAHVAVVRVVHVDQRAQPDPGVLLLFHHVVALGGHQQGARAADEQFVVPLHRHDVGVLGDRPERPVGLVVDPRHRAVRPQMRQRRMEPVVVRVGGRIGQDRRGLLGLRVHIQIRCRCAHGSPRRGL